MLSASSISCLGTLGCLHCRLLTTVSSFVKEDNNCRSLHFIFWDTFYYLRKSLMANHCGILAWKIRWMEELGSLQTMDRRVRHNWATSLCIVNSQSKEIMCHLELNLVKYHIRKRGLMQGTGYCFFPLKKSGSRQPSIDDGFMNIKEEGREEVFFLPGGFLPEVVHKMCI